MTDSQTTRDDRSTDVLNAHPYVRVEGSRIRDGLHVRVRFPPNETGDFLGGVYERTADGYRDIVTKAIHKGERSLINSLIPGDRKDELKNYKPFMCVTYLLLKTNGEQERVALNKDEVVGRTATAATAATAATKRKTVAMHIDGASDEAASGSFAALDRPLLRRLQARIAAGGGMKEDDLVDDVLRSMLSEICNAEDQLTHVLMSVNRAPANDCQNPKQTQLNDWIVNVAGPAYVRQLNKLAKQVADSLA